MGTSQFTFPDPAAEFLANRRVYIRNVVESFNAGSYRVYAGRIESLNLSIDAGRLDPAKVDPDLLAVPTGLAVTSDGLNTMDGGPVGAPIPLHADLTHANDKTPNHFHVGKRNGGSSSRWFSAGQNDTFPGGEETPPTTSEDGVFGVFIKYTAPVGPGWYLLKSAAA